QQSGLKLLAQARHLETLAKVEKADGLLPDLHKFESAAHTLLGLGDLIHAPKIQETAVTQPMQVGTGSVLPDVAASPPASLSSVSKSALAKHPLFVVDDTEGNRDLLS